jgi:hypothetical protein
VERALLKAQKIVKRMLRKRIYWVALILTKRAAYLQCCPGVNVWLHEARKSE